MNSFGPQPSIYLVVDVAEPEDEDRKLGLVQDILVHLSAVAHEHGVSPDERISVVLFAETAEVAVTALPLFQVAMQKPWRLPRSLRRSRTSRSYAGVFDLLRREIGRNAGRTPDTVVVMVTDGSDPNSWDWQPVLDDLVRDVPGLTLLPITHGACEQGTASRLARPGGEVGGIVVRNPSNLVPKIVEGVVTWAQELERKRRAAVRSVDPNDDLAAVGASAAPYRTSATAGLQEISFHGPSMGHAVEPEPPVAMSPPTQVPAPTPVTDNSVESVRTTKLAVTTPRPLISPPATDDGRDSAVAEWEGALTLTPFTVGDPGRASEVRALPDVNEWNQRDTVLDGVTLLGVDDRPVVDLRAASVRGRSHRHSGTVRQDDYAYRCTTDRRFLVCAVSDGVSSARLSHKAAALVTRQGCEILSNELREQVPDEIDWAKVLNGVGAVILDFGARLLQKSRQPGDPGEVTPEEVARQMAATAVFAIVDLRPDGDDLPVYVCTVGDSSAWILRGGHTWQSVKGGKDDGGTITTSRTAALPMVSLEPPQPAGTTLGRDDVLVLITDGLGDPLGDATGPVGRFLTAKWSRPPLALEFAAQVDFARRSHDDDRTALAVWPARSR